VSIRLALLATLVTWNAGADRASGARSAAVSPAASRRVHPDAMRTMEVWPRSGARRMDDDDEIEVVASREGFRPRVVNVRKGQPVRLLLSTADGEHCFALDALRIEKRIVPGRATVLDLTPDRSGTFPFYCCLESGSASDSENGRLVIIE
jgi:heme/copper-type cytochrome/quinol oxidase subunit 2